MADQKLTLLSSLKSKWIFSEQKWEAAEQIWKEKELHWISKDMENFVSSEKPWSLAENEWRQTESSFKAQVEVWAKIDEVLAKPPSEIGYSTILEYQRQLDERTKHWGFRERYWLQKQAWFLGREDLLCRLNSAKPDFVEVPNDSSTKNSKILKAQVKTLEGENLMLKASVEWLNSRVLTGTKKEFEFESKEQKWRILERNLDAKVSDLEKQLQMVCKEKEAICSMLQDREREISDSKEKMDERCKKMGEDFEARLRESTRKEVEALRRGWERKAARTGQKCQEREDEIPQMEGIGMGTGAGFKEEGLEGNGFFGNDLLSDLQLEVSRRKSLEEAHKVQEETTKKLRKEVSELQGKVRDFENLLMAEQQKIREIWEKRRQELAINQELMASYQQREEVMEEFIKGYREQLDSQCREIEDKNTQLAKAAEREEASSKKVVELVKREKHLTNAYHQQKRITNGLQQNHEARYKKIEENFETRLRVTSQREIQALRRQFEKRLERYGNAFQLRMNQNRKVLKNKSLESEEDASDEDSSESCETEWVEEEEKRQLEIAIKQSLAEAKTTTPSRKSNGARECSTQRTAQLDKSKDSRNEIRAKSQRCHSSDDMDELKGAVGGVRKEYLHLYPRVEIINNRFDDLESSENETQSFKRVFNSRYPKTKIERSNGGPKKQKVSFKERISESDYDKDLEFALRLSLKEACIKVANSEEEGKKKKGFFSRIFGRFQMRNV